MTWTLQIPLYTNDLYLFSSLIVLQPLGLALPINKYGIILVMVFEQEKLITQVKDVDLPLISFWECISKDYIEANQRSSFSEVGRKGMGFVNSNYPIRLAL